MKAYLVEYTHKDWGRQGPDTTTTRTEVLDGTPSPSEAEAILARTARMVAPSLFVSCRVLRESTEREARKFLHDARVINARVERAEHAGNTKTGTNTVL